MKKIAFKMFFSSSYPEEFFLGLFEWIPWKKSSVMIPGAQIALVCIGIWEKMGNSTGDGFSNFRCRFRFRRFLVDELWGILWKSALLC